MRGVNDDPVVIKSLVHALMRAKVRPYYLYHCDPVRGANHFRTTVAKGIEIIESLRGHTSGLAIPTYVGGYALVAAFGPRGRLQGWLAPRGVERLPDLYGFVGAWLALTLFTYPYAYLTIRAALSRLDVSLEEASRSLGVGRRATFRRVVLPQLRGSIGVSGLLVALYVLHDFGAVLFEHCGPVELARTEAMVAERPKKKSKQAGGGGGGGGMPDYGGDDMDY
jgi:hypothetical protein